MKPILSLKAIAAFLIFTLGLISVAQAIETNIVVGKYRIGLISEPFSGAAVWKTSSTTYECRYANASEILSILSLVESKSDTEAIKLVEAVKQTRPLTALELDFCSKLASKSNTWIVAKNSTRIDRPVKELVTYKTLKTPRATVGILCGKELYKTSRYSWREILINSKTYAVACEVQ